MMSHALNVSTKTLQQFCGPCTFYTLDAVSYQVFLSWSNLDPACILLYSSYIHIKHCKNTSFYMWAHQSFQHYLVLHSGCLWYTFWSALLLCIFLVRSLLRSETRVRLPWCPYETIAAVTFFLVLSTFKQFVHIPVLYFVSFDYYK